MTYIDHYQLAELCIHSVDHVTKSRHEVEFFHRETPDFHLFAIRGTEIEKFFLGRGWVDVLRDLAIWSKKKGCIIGHAGFVQGWDTIAPFVHELIAVAPEKPVKITGHSMGGAIAVIGAYDLQRSGFKLSELVTFGAPRAIAWKGCVFDHIYEVMNKATQYQHVADPIPGRLLLSRYEHLYTVFVGGSKRLSWWKRRLESHPMQYYLRMVEDRALSSPTVDAERLNENN